MTRTSQITPASFFEAVRAATPGGGGGARGGAPRPPGARVAGGAAPGGPRDAIHLPLDVDRLCRQIREVPELARLGDPLAVHSMAADRSQYLRRPDLGRRLDPSCRTEVQAPGHTGSGSEGSGSAGKPSLAIVIADGLSTAAVAAHAVPVARALVGELGEQFRLAPLVVASQARVAIGDEIGVGLGVGEVIVLIGERPGLSVSDSLGGYLTHGPRPGRRDSERNCVSNIRPDGLSYRLAAATLARLARGAMELGCSGVSLKDDGGQIDAPDRGEIGPAGADRRGRSGD
ncbi:MAG: ethanolamine ammonia-lyase light chain EutC [Acidipropionibacterium jensenii]|nr:ethanolamine ammonia-lyase light chain EutC [Acidipropionibacterium jensenii]